MPDYSEILIRVAQVQRSLTDRLNASATGPQADQLGRTQNANWQAQSNIADRARKDALRDYKPTKK